MANTSAEILRKLKSIDRSEYEPDSLSQIDIWIKQAEQFEATKNLLEHSTIQDWVKEMNTEIKGINDVLLNKVGLDKPERDLLMEKRIMYTKFVQRFDPTIQLDELSRTIDENL